MLGALWGFKEHSMKALVLLSRFTECIYDAKQILLKESSHPATFLTET